MAQLNRPLVRRGALVGILLASVFLADNPAVAFILLVILFGVWNGIYLFVLPGARLLGGIAVLFLSLFTLLVAIPVNWVALPGGLLFVHGNWHAFLAAARLDE
ncbi:MAG: hypothetical protein V5A55_07715 [Halovenus sp.]